MGRGSLWAMGLFLVVFLALQTPSACADVPSCRAAAEDAAARGEYEAFHDLAWRAAQKGKPNDPALMLLVARAQSMSGRPGDALVMLGRLADLHVVVDTTMPPSAFIFFSSSGRTWARTSTSARPWRSTWMELPALGATDFDRTSPRRR